MTIVKARFQIVTPMFLGGAGQKAEGIRPPSIKGALRFWWRALNWGRFRQSPGADDATALRALHTEEARLFGTAASEGQGGQGVFLLSATDHTHAVNVPAPKFSALSYMLGMGLHAAGSTTRNALGGNFELGLRFRRDVAEADKQSIMQAIQAFGLLGSLGSRARHGWGSVALTGIEGWNMAPPVHLEEYQTQARALKADIRVDEPPFSAFSSQTRLVFSRNHKDSGIDVIDDIGTKMGVYRGFGRNGKVFNAHDAEQNFRPDHDNMLDASAGRQPHAAPARLVFGMPHNYFFSSSKGKVDIQKTTGDRERRASPLLLHVHPVLARMFHKSLKPPLVG